MIELMNGENQTFGFPVCFSKLNGLLKVVSQIFPLNPQQSLKSQVEKQQGRNGDG